MIPPTAPVPNQTRTERTTSRSGRVTITDVGVRLETRTSYVPPIGASNCTAPVYSSEPRLMVSRLRAGYTNTGRPLGAVTVTWEGSMVTRPVGRAPKLNPEESLVRSKTV